MKDPISDSLGTAISEPISGEIVDNLEPKGPTEQDNDYQYARENLYNVIEKGSNALESIIDIANASEHPRAFEVVATIMKTLTDANKDLVKMGEDKAKKTEPEKDSNVTNNNVFVGSTKELQSMLKDLRSDE